mmetsp:Transcript_11958/g.19239  ORF Transcript_11958/g.19239 Transcript_11958/m.19239 type:complete len:108 (+) Transcript_11958:36-359(+)
MAQEAGQNNEKILAHEFALKANLDNKQITLAVTDNVTGLKWKLVQTEQDIANIEEEFKKIKAAIDYGAPRGGIVCNFPDEDGGDLAVQLHGQNGSEYEFSLPADDSF